MIRSLIGAAQCRQQSPGPQRDSKAYIRRWVCGFYRNYGESPPPNVRRTNEFEARHEACSRAAHIPMTTSILCRTPSLRCVRSISFSALLLLICSIRPATAAFDWPTSPGWTAGSPGPGQTASQNFTNAETNDLTVAINNSGAAVQGMVWDGSSGGYPQISRVTNTGGFANVDGLQMAVTSSQTAGAFITVTVTFGGPVSNLSFQIWDVDAVAGQAIDRITNIQAIALGGCNIGPDSVTSAVAGFNTISGNGLGFVVVGNGNASDSTNEGTIDIVFSGPLTQFSFQLDNNDPALGGQGIGLGPLSYTPTPEIDPSWIATATCVAAAAFKLVRRKAGRNSR